MQASKLEFWYDFASTYSYLSAMRVEEMARAAGVALEWRPFLLGPIFQAQGWTTSPFNIYPVKGRYMVRDMERLAGERDLAFRMPANFPQNSLKAARIALVGTEQGWIGAFTRAVYEAQFARGADIADASVLAELLTRLGLESAPILARSEDTVIKAKLRATTADAQTAGLFGAPSFRVVSEQADVAPEIFWGDDRLNQAIAWCQKPDANGR